MSAHDDANPRVRRNLRYVHQVQDGKPICVVKDPVSLKYFRFGELEAWLMQQMDGSRSFARIAEDLRQSRGISTTVPAVETFHRRLKELALAERTQAERSVLVLEAVRAQRQSRLQSNGNTLFRMRFSLGDPAELFDRVIDKIRFFWSPGFVVFSVIAFLSYALIIALNWGAFQGGMFMMYDPANFTFGFILTFYITALLVVVVHELGHGLTCKNFGGEVHELGGMLIYFSPAMFCNVNDAWTFEKKSHRLWVTFAGAWINLIMAAVAAVVWISVEPDTFVHRVAFITMLVGGGLALLLNFNPLIPLDGYYALMDWLEIPNLRARSFEYLGAAFKRGALGLDVALPPTTPREARIFLIFGVLALVYTSLILIFVGSWVAGLIIGKIGAWGWALVVFGAWRLTRRPLQRSSRVLKVWAAEKLPGRRARRIAGGLSGGVALLTLVVLFVPWTVQAEGRALVEPVHRTWLRPADEGWIERIAAFEGGEVNAGDTVAVLRNPELEIAWVHARTAAQTFEREAAAARGAGNTALARRAELQLAAQRIQFSELDRRRASLVLLAPFSGQVVTPHLQELIGAHAAPGDSLVELWDSRELRVRISLPQQEAGAVSPGSAVALKFPAQAGHTWRTRVQQVSPAAQNGEVEALALLDPVPSSEAGAALRAGMVGKARIVVERTSVAGALLRGLRRTIRLDWLL